jgi:hypothetical protein
MFSVRICLVFTRGVFGNSAAMDTGLAEIPRSAGKLRDGRSHVREPELNGRQEGRANLGTGLPVAQTRRGNPRQTS